MKTVMTLALFLIYLLAVVLFEVYRVPDIARAAIILVVALSVWGSIKKGIIRW
ncbi:hypothetical protein [Piscirickettsia litoralis]|uniref:hypothetical protein n=1 Tax=Piscirickettsia litoralis TaxID=1891921 RepID=UPI001300FE2B|nr:hypothetical protein [Piscirickettsia litoralis]